MLLLFDQKNNYLGKKLLMKYPLKQNNTKTKKYIFMAISTVPCNIKSYDQLQIDSNQSGSLLHRLLAKKSHCEPIRMVVSNLQLIVTLYVTGPWSFPLNEHGGGNKLVPPKKKKMVARVALAMGHMLVMSLA